MTKECRACGEVKSLDDFYEGRGIGGRRARCKACAAEEARERRLKDPDGHRERKRQTYLRRRESHYAYLREHRAQNPEIWRAYRRRRAEFERAMSDQDREYIGVLRSDPCSYCGAPAEGSDHIDALAAGGAVGWENLTAACGSCNSSKHVTPLLQFLLH